MPDQLRTVLITGANGGIGRSIAEAFASDEEHSIWLGIRRGRDHADALVAKYPGRCHVVSLDVAEPSSWDAALADITKATDRLDVLVNNAGSHEDHLLATMPADSWSQSLESNLSSVFHGCQKVVRTMMAQRFGRIINIASLSALLPPPGQTNYAAAKAGVIGLTRSLSKEVARAGITVNAICPGYIETDALSEMGDERRKAAIASIPMRRFGRPEEVAAAVRFLACPEAGYITGSVLKIDGGIF